ncbi:RNHCP domain-containing protein [Streptomyces scopuliridis]|uniref:RNHCP domain-containing protein n=1 Tax=Streptomyces scopuliridis TaxID=452529 RepID=UPI00367DE475
MSRLRSRHADDTPDDRAADCGARIEPLAISVRGDGEWVLVHQRSRQGARSFLAVGAIRRSILDRKA